MRLIDADALKEEISGEWFVEPNATIFNYVFNMIDNAPTVEPEVKEVPIATVTFDTEKLKELTNDIVERIKSGELVVPRQKGEWITNDVTLSAWRCDKCLYATPSTYNFCPNCGADMRGETDDG